MVDKHTLRDEVFDVGNNEWLGMEGILPHGGEHPNDGFLFVLPALLGAMEDIVDMSDR